jgi:hypothetical protein
VNSSDRYWRIVGSCYLIFTPSLEDCPHFRHVCLPLPSQYETLYFLYLEETCILTRRNGLHHRNSTFYQQFTYKISLQLPTLSTQGTNHSVCVPDWESPLTTSGVSIGPYLFFLSCHISYCHAIGFGLPIGYLELLKLVTTRTSKDYAVAAHTQGLLSLLQSSLAVAC